MSVFQSALRRCNCDAEAFFLIRDRGIQRPSERNGRQHHPHAVDGEGSPQTVGRGRQLKAMVIRRVI